MWRQTICFDAYISLAREFQIIANRCNNAELCRRAESENAEPPHAELKDVDLAELESKMLRKFMDAANRLLFEAEELEGYFGGYQWEDSDGTISLREFQDNLYRIGAYPKAILPAGKGGRFQEVVGVGQSKIVVRHIKH